MSKRAFVRILWGDIVEKDNPVMKDLNERFDVEYDPDNPILVRRVKIQRDIEKCMKRQFQVPFVVYVYGSKNYEMCKEKGIDAILVDERPYKFHPTKKVFEHKIDLYPKIAEDFDEFVFLDWDCYLRKPLPDCFWEKLNEKQPLQASVHKYSRPRLNHRHRSANKFCPTGAFVYMRGKDVPKRIWEVHKEMGNKWSCEPQMAMVMDELSGGWKGMDYYWNNFEPDFYTAKRSPYRWDREKYDKGENNCFRI